MQLLLDDYFKSQNISPEAQSDATYQIMGQMQFACSPAGKRKYPDIETNAKALREPSNSDLWKLAFSQNDKVSSIIPSLVNQKIPSFSVRGKIIDAPEDFAQLCLPLRSPYFESTKVAFLNRNRKIIHSEVLTVGVLDQALLDPPSILRAITQKAERLKTLDVILSHNHPSGDPTPSDADIGITHQIKTHLKETGINLLDHVITNGTKYHSILTHQAGVIRGQKSAWEVVSRDDLKQINDLRELDPIAKALRSGDPENGHIIYTNAKKRIVAVERFPLDIDAAQFKKKVVIHAAQEGALAFFLDIPSKEMANSKFLPIARQVGSLSGTTLLDISSSTCPSFRNAGYSLYEKHQGFPQSETPSIPVENKIKKFRRI